MRLMICTQKVDINDGILGFFHSWIKEFSRQAEEVTVICLYKGKYELPANVKVLSLGKEKKGLKYFQFLQKLKYIYRFYKYIFFERKSYDKVFVHMNPEYFLLGGTFWKLWKKKTALWFTHKSVNWKLKLAEKFVDRIFTASKESCNLNSKKICIVGHGIDTNYFQTPKEKKKNSKFQIIYVGRLSQIKNQLLALEAVNELIKSGLKNIFLTLIGSSPLADDTYEKRLKEYVKDNGLYDYVGFAGAVPYRQILPYYHRADLALNLCPTGGMDKAVLEAAFCRVSTIVLNKTFLNILDQECFLEADDRVLLARKIKDFMKNDPKIFRLNGYSVTSLISRICQEL